MSIGLTFLGVLLFLTSLFMMMLILVQRGKGGGLTGALGGMGGQSAFGAKAGDVFTKITVITAIIWITLCMVTIAAFNPPPSSAGLKDNTTVSTMISGDEESDAAATDGASAGDDSSESASDGAEDTADTELEKYIEDEVGTDAEPGETSTGGGADSNIEPGTDAASDEASDATQPAESADDQ